MRPHLPSPACLLQTPHAAVIICIIPPRESCAAGLLGKGPRLTAVCVSRVWCSSSEAPCVVELQACMLTVVCTVQQSRHSASLPSHRDVRQPHSVSVGSGGASVGIPVGGGVGGKRVGGEATTGGQTRPGAAPGAEGGMCVGGVGTGGRNSGGHLKHGLTQNLDPQFGFGGAQGGGDGVGSQMSVSSQAETTTQTAEDQVVELVRALLLHLRSSEGKEWVDITNMPKAAHMLQRKRPVVGVSLRWGSRDVGPEEWQRLMAEIRARHGKLANFLSKHATVFELRSRPGGKEIRLVPGGRIPSGVGVPGGGTAAQSLESRTPSAGFGQSLQQPIAGVHPSGSSMQPGGTSAMGLGPRGFMGAAPALPGVGVAQAGAAALGGSLLGSEGSGGMGRADLIWSGSSMDLASDESATALAMQRAAAAAAAGHAWLPSGQVVPGKTGGGYGVAGMLPLSEGAREAAGMDTAGAARMGGGPLGVGGWYPQPGHAEMLLRQSFCDNCCKFGCAAWIVCFVCIGCIMLCLCYERLPAVL